MKPQKLTLLLVAAAMGVTACGGSSKKAASTVAQVATPATTDSTPATTTTTERKVSTKHLPANHRRSTRPKPAPVETGTSAPPAPAPQRTANPLPTGHVTGPYPDTCLTNAGLVNAHAFERDIWMASNPFSHTQLFVEGPYKTLAMASGSAQSLQGVELSYQGGLYVVSAELRSGLGVQARHVASCLRAVSGTGTIKF